MYLHIIVKCMHVWYCVGFLGLGLGQATSAKNSYIHIVCTYMAVIGTRLDRYPVRRSFNATYLYPLCIYVKLANKRAVKCKIQRGLLKLVDMYVYMMYVNDKRRPPIDLPFNSITAIMMMFGTPSETLSFYRMIFVRDCAINERFNFSAEWFH
jgi:hypothetical protein